MAVEPLTSEFLVASPPLPLHVIHAPRIERSDEDVYVLQRNAHLPEIIYSGGLNAKAGKVKV